MSGGDPQKERSSRPDYRKVEPLFAALGEEEGRKTTPNRASLYWKLLWAAVVLIALLALVLHQAF